jgi:hypothetical protein
MTPREWSDYQERVRARTLRALLRELDKAAHNNEPWYVWIRDEWPRIKRAKV